MDAEPPFLAENELEFVVGTGKGTSMNCPLIPRGSSRGYKAYSTRNQAGILETVTDFLTTHRKKIHCFLQLNICCSLLLFSPFSGEDFGGLL